MEELCKKKINTTTKDKVKSVGLKVKMMREEKKLSQQDLAYFIHSDKSCISEIERGMCDNLTIKTVVKLGMFFNIEVYDMLL